LKPSGSRRNAHPCRVAVAEERMGAWARVQLWLSRAGTGGWTAVEEPLAILVHTLRGLGLRRRAAVPSSHPVGNAPVNAQVVVQRCGAQQNGERSERHGNLHTQSGAKDKRGFRGTTPAWGVGERAHWPGPGPKPHLLHRVGKGAGESETWELVDGVRDLACMWSFGPSAVEDDRTWVTSKAPSSAKSSQRSEDLVAPGGAVRPCLARSSAKQVRHSWHGEESCW